MDSKTLNSRLKNIKMLVMDVDGTMTDGTVYYSKNGEELKRFSIRDGMGINLLIKGNIIPAIITSENSEIVTARAKKLGINYVVLGSRNKTQSLKELSESANIPLSDIAFIGDDINDLNVMKICGLSACPKDSVLAVKEIADFNCSYNGGKGAIRELIEMILLSQNKEITLNENW